MQEYVPEELLTVRQHAQRYGYLTEAALRDLIFRSSARVLRGKRVPPNGLAAAFHHRGRRVYVDPLMLRKLIADVSAEARNGQ